MKIIDAHSHIDYITHKCQKDVVGTVCNTVDEKQWSWLIKMAQEDNNIYAGFGIHPWYVESADSECFKRLETLLKMNRSFMVGEIGLDKYRPNMEKQIEFFIKQFEIAMGLQRTVFVHCVGAWDKILHILKQYKQSPKIVFHAFNGNDDILKHLLQNNNMYFSFGKNALYDGFCRIEQIPIDKILIESDGKKDIILIDIINKISQIKNNKNIDKIIYDNTRRVLSDE